MPYDGLTMAHFLQELIALAGDNADLLTRLNTFFDDPPPDRPAIQCMQVIADLDQLVIDLYLSQLSDTTLNHIIYHSIVVCACLCSLSCVVWLIVFMTS